MACRIGVDQGNTIAGPARFAYLDLVSEDGGGVSAPLASAEWLAREYGLGRVLSCTVAARGAMGGIFRLRTTTGAYAAKQFFWQQPDESEVSRVIAFTTACRKAGVPSPETLAGPRRRFAHEHPATGQSWQVQRWIQGAVPDRLDVLTAIWLAQQMATIHRLALRCDEGAEIDPWYLVADHDWLALSDHALACNAPWSDGFASRTSEFAALATVANSAPSGDVVMCHRDLKAVNTLLEAGGQRWLLDWDNCGPQESWRELGNLLLHHVGDDSAVAAIADAYQDAGGCAAPRSLDIFATGLAVWLNFLHGQATLALDETAEREHRSFAGDEVAALVDGFPAMQALESAAAAWR